MNHGLFGLFELLLKHIERKLKLNLSGMMISQISLYFLHTPYFFIQLLV
ncbi:hypothetical protein X559_2783 [Paenilisteria newyorkensis]|nr:hypothetical protein X559_2783 [Listeria newyorkensis]